MYVIYECMYDVCMYVSACTYVSLYLSIYLSIYLCCCLALNFWLQQLQQKHIAVIFWKWCNFKEEICY